jgi:hypothetical protein
MMMRGPAQQGLAKERGAIPIGDVPAQVEVVDAGTSSGIEGVHKNEVGPRSEDRAGGDVLDLGSLDAMSPVVIALGLSGYPSVSSLLANWKRVEDGAELACSQVAAACQLLLGAMAIVDQDLQDPVRVCPEERKDIT